MSWNPALYSCFLKETGLPLEDLLSRLKSENPKEILDLGSGTGKSTGALKTKFPDAHVVGGEDSEEMLAFSRKAFPELSFIPFDARKDFDKYYCHFDMVFSSDCIQCVPDHKKLIRDMMWAIKPEGILAVQVPLDSEEPISKETDDAIASPEWKDKLQKRPHYILSEREYHEELMKYSSSVEILKITYYHALGSHKDILEWYSSTSLKPYLEQLDDSLRESFLSDILGRIEKCYPVSEDGTVLFPFPRLFLIARKKEKVVKNKFIPKADTDMMVLDHYEHHMGG